MKFLLPLLLICAPILSYGGTAQDNNIVQFGGGLNPGYATLVLPQNSASSALQLISSVVSSTANYYLLVVKSGSNSGNYQVTNGKTFYITGIFTYCAAANCSFTLGYGDAAPSGNSVVGAPTNAVYFSAGSGVPSIVTGATGGKTDFFPITGAVPSQKYPFVQTITGSDQMNFIIQGVEL